MRYLPHNNCRQLHHQIRDIKGPSSCKCFNGGISHYPLHSSIYEISKRARKGFFNCKHVHTHTYRTQVCRWVFKRSLQLRETSYYHCSGMLCYEMPILSPLKRCCFLSFSLLFARMQGTMTLICLHNGDFRNSLGKFRNKI